MHSWSAHSYSITCLINVKLNINTQCAWISSLFAADPLSPVVGAMQHGQLERISAIRKRQFEASQQLSVLSKEIERFELLGSLKLQEKKKLKWEIRGMRKEALQTMDYNKEEWDHICQSVPLIRRTERPSDCISANERYSPAADSPRMIEHVQSCSVSTSRPRPSSCRPSSSSPRPGFYMNFDPWDRSDFGRETLMTT
jgi:hypothetical protein